MGCDQDQKPSERRPTWDRESVQSALWVPCQVGEQAELQFPLGKASWNSLLFICDFGPTVSFPGFQVGLDGWY